MAQKEQDRKDFALTLKKMLSFNALVVTPLLTKIKGVESAAKALADAMIKAQQSEEWGIRWFGSDTGSPESDQS